MEASAMVKTLMLTSQEHDLDHLQQANNLALLHRGVIAGESKERASHLKIEFPLKMRRGTCCPG
jgi:hypothetical protein